MDKTLTQADKALNEREAAAKEATQLMQQLFVFERLQHAATSRKQRQEDLMSRRSAKGWSPAKKAQMVRRLVRANQEIEQSVTSLEQLREKLQLQVLVARHQAPLATAGIVPPPATTSPA